MITVRCRCGQVYQADEAHVGKAIRCRCGQVLEIAAPVPTHSSSGREPSLRESAPTPGQPVTSSYRAAGRRPGWGMGVGVAATAGILYIAWVIARPEPSDTNRFGPPPVTIQRPAPAAPPVLTSPPAAQMCPEDSVRWPTSSAELGGRYRGGLGRLRVVNGTDYDAVALLVHSATNTPRRAIYIRSRERGIITQVPTGTYRLRFQLGRKWHVRRFFCDVRGTSEFDDPVDFEEIERNDAVEYSTFEVTLHPVALGTARTHPISQLDFQLPTQ